LWIPVLLTAVVLFIWWTPFRLLALAAAGRSPVCPLSLAVQSGDHGRRLAETTSRILRGSHFRRQDEAAGIGLWSTPKGDFWIPAGNRYVLPFNLAEMELQVYGSGRNFVQPGDIVLDCGASDGDFTREALRAGAKLVVSIEVSPRTVECLR